MEKQFHILNGDALKQRFPKSILGNLIVMRECLVDGDVQGKTLEELLSARAQFMSTHYDNVSVEGYFKRVNPEFEKIKNLPNEGEVNLWFEDDLFCQVNFWFIAHLLFLQKKEINVFLVRPQIGCEYSFGKMSQEELTMVFHKKIKIEKTELKQLSQLWKSYQSNDETSMIKIAKSLNAKFPFIQPAVNAHLERLKNDRPTQSILQIIEELQTKDFGKVFQEFCKREEIYGFGDLQVKRILNRMTELFRI